MDITTYKVRFHGRGGQGAVTAANLLAVAASLDGKYSRSFPFFGVERRGAPVQAFCRVADKVIRKHQHVYDPDYAVVLDASLLPNVDVCMGLTGRGGVIVNCSKQAKDLELKTDNVYVVDATSIAIKHIGRPIFNTAMLGAFAKVSGWVTLESLKEAIKGRFSPEVAEKNIKAAEECYESVKK